MTPTDIQCPHCGSDNPAGSTSCIDCGNVLAAHPTLVTGQPSYQAAPATLPKTTASPTVSIVIERSGRNVMQATFAKESILVGRGDVDDSGMPVIPDIDLTDHDTERLVSRKHLLLHASEAGIQVEDLGSGNGSYVEHVGQLKPGVVTSVAPGARIMLGRGGLVLTARV